ncbi:MAG: carboxypeptidase regulatory-like domain-containing protein [Elusimicrobia bacterium]|nr:carboxypeptidase regulatory-like domain-containing protein [Elusimicrobiota bacterium]
MSLVELIIAMTLLSIGAVALMGTFQVIGRSIQTAKERSLATNLCQEQLQILKQKNYYRVLITTAPAYDARFTPAEPYDNSFFLPETIEEGGMRFTRYTFVEIAQEVSGNVTTLAPTSADTGMKLVTVTTLWQRRGETKKLQMRSVMSNPDAVMTNSILRGKVTNSVGAVAIPNANITLAENTGFTDTTNATGDYIVNLYPGNYNLMVTAPGFFDVLVPAVVPANAAVTVNVALNPMANRDLQGWVWLNDNLVISQIMGSTATALPSGMTAEYVEIFNPTTYTWTVAGDIRLTFQPLAWLGPQRDIVIDFTGSTVTLPSGGYYLFANTGPVTINGVSVMPDAVWDATVGGANDLNFPYFDTTPGAENYNAIPINTDGAQQGAGVIKLYQVSTGKLLDKVGWKGGGAGFWPPDYENNPIDQMVGLSDNEQYTRFSSTAGVSTTVGRAYDMGWNFYDFWDTAQAGGVRFAPHNRLSPLEPIVSGEVPIGGSVSCNDGLSTPADIDWDFFNNGVSNAWAGRYYLTNVATGTWSLYAAFNNAFQQIDNVVVPVGAGVLPMPNAATAPPWPAANTPHLFLTSSTTDGWVLGTVTKTNGTGISPAITVTNGMTSALASTVWPYRFFLKTSPGTYNLTANPGNLNSSYVSVSSPAVTVTVGQVTSGVDFVLPQGGGLFGFVTRDGVNPLPGIAITATNSSGLVEGTVVSAPDGKFRMANIATNTYTVETQLSSGETASPASFSTVVPVGAPVFVGTFTVSGASGFISGSVSLGGAPLRTGVVVVASTATIVTPPTINAATLLGAGYFLGSSYENGSYLLEVRGSTSTTYKVYAYYPTYSAGVWTNTVRSSTSVSVLPGFTKSG